MDDVSGKFEGAMILVWLVIVAVNGARLIGTVFSGDWDNLGDHFKKFLMAVFCVWLPTRPRPRDDDDAPKD